jgi:[ribosomal protein S5]-alanine N-acetyltransferase
VAHPRHRLALTNVSPHTAHALADLLTPRLRLHRFVSEDAVPLFAFMSQPSAMKHTYLAPSLAQCLARLRAYEAMRPVLGFAPWVVRTSDKGELVGWGGLSIDPDEPVWGLEVSYALAPNAWGKGYATELVQHALAQAFGVLNAPEVHAYARPENAASIRVLHKCGFRLLRHEHTHQRHHYLATAARAA